MTLNDLAVNWEDFRGRKGCGGGVPPPPSPRPAATRPASLASRCETGHETPDSLREAVRKA